MATSSCLMPALRQLSTARSLYLLAHTAVTAAQASAPCPAPPPPPPPPSTPVGPRTPSGQGLTLVHFSGQREHFMSHVVECFAGFSDKNGSG
jgi:hypothetical protein